MSLELLFQHKVNSVDDQESLHFEYATSSPTETIPIWYVVWFIATLHPKEVVQGKIAFPHLDRHGGFTRAYTTSNNYIMIFHVGLNHPTRVVCVLLVHRTLSPFGSEEDAELIVQLVHRFPGLTIWLSQRQETKTASSRGGTHILACPSHGSEGVCDRRGLIDKSSRYEELPSREDRSPVYRCRWCT